MLNEELVNISKARISHADDCLRETKSLLKAEEYKGAGTERTMLLFILCRRS